MWVKNILRDPLFRRFLSASFFAGAFVWVAVTYFNVDTEVIKVFLIMSFIFVAAMIFIGLLLVPLIKLTHKKRSSFLESIKPAPTRREKRGSDQ